MELQLFQKREQHISKDHQIKWKKVELVVNKMAQRKPQNKHNHMTKKIGAAQKGKVNIKKITHVDPFCIGTGVGFNTVSAPSAGIVPRFASD